jgi:hypothetical protein
VTGPILYDHITACEVNRLAVIEFKPDLTLEDHGVVDRMCSVHRWIFFFEVVGQSRQAAKRFLPCSRPCTRM